MNSFQIQEENMKDNLILVKKFLDQTNPSPSYRSSGLYSFEQDQILFTWTVGQGKHEVLMRN